MNHKFLNVPRLWGWIDTPSGPPFVYPGMRVGGKETDLRLPPMMVSRTARFGNGFLSATADAYRRKFIQRRWPNEDQVAGILVAAGITRETPQEGESTRGSR